MASRRSKRQRSTLEDSGSSQASPPPPPPPRLPQSPAEASTSTEKVSVPLEQPTLAMTEEDDESSYTCSICFEAWTHSGEHRVVSVKCGHLFGKRCIERWIALSASSSSGKGKGKTVAHCPQCNAVTRTADIRPIYVKQLKVVDRSELDRLEKQLAEERARRESTEREKARILLAEQMLRDEVQRKEREVVRWKRDYEAIQVQLSMSSPFSPSQISQARSTGQSVFASPVPAVTPLPLTKSFHLHRKIPVPSDAPGSRVFDFMPETLTFLVSQSRNNNNGVAASRRHGIAKLHATREGVHEWIPDLHRKPLTDIRVSPNRDGMFLTAGMDESINVVSGHSNSIVQKLSDTLGSGGSKKSMWSCCWGPTSSHLVYAGCSESTVLSFDLRWPTAAVDVYPAQFGNPYLPIRFLEFATMHEIQFLCVGNFAGFGYLNLTYGPEHLQILRQRSNASESYAGLATQLGERNIMGNHCLHVVSQLRTESGTQFRVHYLEPDEPTDISCVLTANANHRSLSRPALGCLPFNEGHAPVLIANHSKDNMMQLFQLGNSVDPTNLPPPFPSTCTTPIVQSKFVDILGKPFLSSLSEQELVLFEWK